MNFLTGKKLEEQIYDTIYYAEKYLVILSPFIQLDDYFKDKVFKTHLNNSQVQIVLGFGKNEQNISRSFKQQDINFFTQFPNISIVYIPNLHAKYYGNEKKSIVTSMNLIDYSFLNNIEFGVLAEKKVITTNNNLFNESYSQCMDIIEKEGQTIFVKRPKYERKLLGFSKNYVGSEIELDLTNEISRGKNIEKIPLSRFQREKYVNPTLKETRKEREQSETKQCKTNSNLTSKKQNKEGHCIRCGTNIKLDLDRPLCWDCFNKWVEYENEDYPENYCMSCGKRINVSFAKPACYSCYQKL